MPASPLGNDLAPRLAQRLNTGLISHCIKLDLDMSERLLLGTVPTLGGEVYRTFACPEARPQMATMRPKTVPPAERDESRKGEIIKMDGKLDPSALRVKVVDRIEEEAEGVKLEDAEVVVCGGRGIGSKENFEALRELAVQEEEFGDFDDALVHWRRYIDLVPEDPRALLGAGRSAIGAGEIPEALKALEEARRRWPERPEPTVQLAIALMHSGRVHESLPLLCEAAREHPAHHHAEAALALALLASGRNEEGMALVRTLQDRGFSLGAFFASHGRRFLESGPHRLAVAVLQPLADAGMITPEQGSILMRAQRAQGSRRH